MRRLRPSSEVLTGCRQRLLASITPLVSVRDEFGGGYRLQQIVGGKKLEMVVSGLGKALKERIYSSGPGFVSDNGPSTVLQGVRVHMHVCHIVECLQFGSVCTCRARFKHPAKATKGARAIMHALQVMGLYPIASEVMLLAPKWNLATRADLVCVNGEGEYVLVSLKTGDGATQKTGRFFRAPRGMDTIADTQRARHQLQLLAEYVLLSNAGISVTRALILYVEMRKTDPRCASVPAARWWWKNRELHLQFDASMCV